MKTTVTCMQWFILDEVLAQAFGVFEIHPLLLFHRPTSANAFRVDGNAFTGSAHIVISPPRLPSSESHVSGPPTSIPSTSTGLPLELHSNRMTQLSGRLEALEGQLSRVELLLMRVVKP